MPEPTDDRTSAEQLTKAFQEFWSSHIAQLDDATRQQLEAWRKSIKSPQVNREWLDAASAGMEAYLRSPAFLGTMKQNIDALIRAKRQWDDASSAMAASLGVGAQDEVRELEERLGRLEESWLARCRAIEARLSALEAKLNLDAQGP